MVDIFMGNDVGLIINLIKPTNKLPINIYLLKLVGGTASPVVVSI